MLLALFNPLRANPTKWLNTLKQFVGNWSTNCLSVFDHFVELALKGLTVLPTWLSSSKGTRLHNFPKVSKTWFSRTLLVCFTLHIVDANVLYLMFCTCIAWFLLDYDHLCCGHGSVYFCSVILKVSLKFDTFMHNI